MLPEEIYVVSHHVHHTKSDTPGDPYNAQGGFWYCFLADVNHQPIAHDLNEKDYARVVEIMHPSGVACNTYAQYQKWGTVTQPLSFIISVIINWAFWYGAFYLIGGHALATTLFAGALIWGVGVRTFNFEGHGKGKDKRIEGVDFDRKNMSINQYWPGYVAGEWHNNHHLFPTSARSGFLPYQIDLAWIYIYTLYLLGGVKSYTDSKEQFMSQYYMPYKKELASHPQDKGAGESI
jgi:stearoyl-CoA desaturase (delta-9 desaturase)